MADIYEIMYQDLVMTGYNPPSSQFFVVGEELAKTIVDRLQAGVDCEANPGGKYFYTDPLAPFFTTMEEYEAWSNELVEQEKEADNGPF